MRTDGVRSAAVAGLLLLGAIGLLLLEGAFWRSVWHPGGRVDPSPPDAADADRWSPVDCWFERTLPAHCGWLWPTRQDEAGQTRLPVVVLQRAAQPSRRATIYLSGGPGGSSYLGFDTIQHWDDWRESVGLDHDLVLYDPRGAGLARPSLACAPLQAEMRAGLAHDIGTPEARDASWRSYERVLRRCAQKVAPADRAGGLYSTPVHAQDVLELIDTLQRERGYRSISLYGVSYGSRLAVAAAAADRAGAIGRLALDAWYPAGVDLVTREAQTWHEAFDDYAGWFAGPAECAAGAESLRAGVATLLATAPLARRTIDVSLESYGRDVTVAVRLSMCPASRRRAAMTRGVRT